MESLALGPKSLALILEGLGLVTSVLGLGTQVLGLVTCVFGLRSQVLVNISEHSTSNHRRRHHHQHQQHMLSRMTSLGDSLNGRNSHVMDYTVCHKTEYRYPLHVRYKFHSVEQVQCRVKIDIHVEKL